jgi:hypothetical protein
LTCFKYAFSSQPEKHPEPTWQGMTGHWLRLWHTIQLRSSRFYLQEGVGGDGLGVGSDGFYAVLGVVGYWCTPSIGTTLGYRMFEVDYGDGGFGYDVRQEGLLMGLTWAF